MIAYDPFDPAVIENPYPHYEALRAEQRRRSIVWIASISGC